MIKKFKPAGGIIDPLLSDKQIYVPEVLVNKITDSLSSHFTTKNKAIIKNFVTIEVKKSERKTRYDLKKKVWVNCTPKNRLSIKFNKKFTDKILESIK